MDAKSRNEEIPTDWDRRGLPGWCYHSPALLELEKDQLFKTHWQIACHVSDIPDAGSYLSFDLCEERAIIVRDNDLEVRAFHNICRHRGSRLVAKEQGTCPNALICPFHGWVYNLDGTLRGAARPASFPPLDKNEFGLRSSLCGSSPALSHPSPSCWHRSKRKLHHTIWPIMSRPMVSGRNRPP